MGHATANVFVDDYVKGHLPRVCVVTGIQTSDQVRFRTNVRPMSPAWLLLIFLGPLGWIVLAMVALSSGEKLEGWLPYSHEEALERRALRTRVMVVSAVIAVLLVLLDVVLHSGILVWLALGAVVVGLVVLVVLGNREPRISLDASRRWVAIDHCHPDFARAVAGSAADLTSI